MIAIAEAYGFQFEVPAADLAVGRCLRRYGEFGRIGSTVAAQLSQGLAFVDVGANVGAYALPVSRSAREVVAIEPQPGIAALLRRNVLANKVGNVTVLEAAATDRVGEIAFPSVDLAEPTNFGAVGIGRAGPTVNVTAVRLDDVAPADTAIVKIDVEGHEGKVLAGAAKLLASCRPYWIVEVSSDRPETRATIEGFRAGYRIYWFYDPFVTPRAPRGNWSGEEPGDICILAAPRNAKQPVGMVEIEPSYSWPQTSAGFTYLRAFGIAEA